MKINSNLSNHGKHYCLKHILLIRNFCFACNEAVSNGDLNRAKFYKNWAHRIVKGINPFCKLLTDDDHPFLSKIKQELEVIFERIEPFFLTNQLPVINNVIAEIIAGTIEIEKNVWGISLAQLSKKLLTKNENLNYSKLVKNQ